MGQNGKISEYRERLDRTLASPELTNDDTLKTLIRDQLLRSSLNEDKGCNEDVIERKTREVSYFLDMLRSASVSEHETPKTGQTSHGEWKLKDDNEEYRVMYRPGPQGTPLHTLLVEGYVDGPLDICLCISWETTLYRKWWPQIIFPPFKITICKCLQKVRIGEHVSLMRVKVTWPLSAREAVMHYFLFEYLKDGLVVVLINSISDSESIDRSTHGFTRDGIPEVKDFVRIDFVGGFAIQKVASKKCYFRTIGTVDLKLDFVPPSLLNFISRQLIGSGFRLYQKAVESVSKYDEDYSKALKDPVYVRVREALLSVKSNEATERKDVNSDFHLPLHEDSKIDMPKSLADVKQKIPSVEDAGESVIENEQATNMKNCAEIEEVDAHEIEESRQMKDEIRCAKQGHCDNSVTENLRNTTTDGNESVEIEEYESEFSIDLDNDGKSIYQSKTDKIAERSPANCRTNIMLSPEVERALDTLEKAISLVRERGLHNLARFSTIAGCENFQNVQKNSEKYSALAEVHRESSETKVPVGAREEGGIVGRTSNEYRNSSSNHDVRRSGSSSLTRDVNHNRIAPASPDQCLLLAGEGNQLLSSSKDGITDLMKRSSMLGDDKSMLIDINGSQHEEKKLSRRMLCCFGPGRLRRP